LLAPQVDSQGFLEFTLIALHPSDLPYMLRTASAACVVILSSYTGATYLRLVFFS
ncbi:hypothetical protein K443DRAFT_37034, partial [Laccaria amethystina LaAM-08-1]